jgi:hypothetical protein
MLPPGRGLSQPTIVDSIDTPQLKTELILIDTAEVVKRGENTIQQLNLETKKSKSLSKSIQRESKKKPEEARKLLPISINIEGRVLHKEPDLIDSILVVSDTTFIELNSSTKVNTKPKTKEPFFIRWFRKNK